MASSTTLDESIEGNRVVANDGDEFGIVSGVRSNTMYVDLDPGLDDRLLARLGWDDVAQSDYPLGTDAIARVTDDAVHLEEL
mgnify:CR=1 FL=1